MRVMGYEVNRLLGYLSRAHKISFPEDGDFLPPRIHDDLLHSTLFLYPDEAAAQAGERLGGSGFIVGVPYSETGLASIDAVWGTRRFLDVPERVVSWVVTNRHVIEQGHWTLRV